MRERSDAPSSVNVCLLRPGGAASRREPRSLARLRRLMAQATAWWRGDDVSLRALAAIDADRISDLSEAGRRLRRAARRRFHLSP